MSQALCKHCFANFNYSSQYSQNRTFYSLHLTDKETGPLNDLIKLGSSRLSKSPTTQTGTTETGSYAGGALLSCSGDDNALQGSSAIRNKMQQGPSFFPLKRELLL